MPPNFADVEYWNDRFGKESEPFEWLNTPDALLPYLKPIISGTSMEDQKILHLGPGSSNLSMVLRTQVARPEVVHNVDYSQSAIQLGRAMERKLCSNETESRMNWWCLDILRPASVKILAENDLFEPQFSLVVDKSSADSIACGPNLLFNARMFRTIFEASSNDGHDASDLPQVEYGIHPVAALALHLAVLCAPGAHWISVSYSSDRYAILSEQEDIEKHLQPGLYWTLESIEPMLVDELAGPPGHDSISIPRPSITYWLYKLRRTDRIIGLWDHFL